MGKKPPETHDEPIQIHLDNIDVDRIMDAVRERVAKKRTAGAYDRYNLTAAAALEVATAKSEEDLLRHTLKVMQKTHELDLGHFDIPSKGGLFGRPAVWLKKLIWAALKFYTFRMFTQQRAFNAQVVHALRALNTKIDKLAKSNKANEPRISTDDTDS